MNVNLPYVEVTSEKLRHILKSHKKDPFSTLKSLYVKSFVNQKIE